MPSGFARHRAIAMRKVKFPFSLPDRLQLVSVIQVIGFLGGLCLVVREQRPDVLPVYAVLGQFRPDQAGDGGEQVDRHGRFLHTEFAVMVPGHQARVGSLHPPSNMVPFPRARGAAEPAWSP